jgi:hypothetical protein
MAEPRNGVPLIVHEGEKFASVVIALTGHFYHNCEFDRCTMLLTGPAYRMEGCRLTACNFRIEYDVLAGDPGTRSALRQILDLIDGAMDATG